MARHNIAEAVVIAELEDEGYEVLDKGWPDFLAYRYDDGDIQDVRLIEVKCEGQKVNWHQHCLHQRLEELGIPVEIRYVDIPAGQRTKSA